jgi:hypothetical protein
MDMQTPSGKNCVTCGRGLMLGESVWQSPVTHNITSDGVRSTVDYECDGCHDLGDWVRSLLPSGYQGYVEAVTSVRERMAWSLQQSAEFVKAIKRESASVRHG